MRSVFSKWLILNRFNTKILARQKKKKEKQDRKSSANFYNDDNFQNATIPYTVKRTERGTRRLQRISCRLALCQGVQNSARLASRNRWSCGSGHKMPRYCSAVRYRRRCCTVLSVARQSPRKAVLARDSSTSRGIWTIMKVRSVKFKLQHEDSLASREQAVPSRVLMAFSPGWSERLGSLEKFGAQGQFARFFWSSNFFSFFFLQRCFNNTMDISSVVRMYVDSHYAGGWS